MFNEYRPTQLREKSVRDYNLNSKTNYIENLNRENEREIRRELNFQPRSTTLTAQIAAALNEKSAVSSKNVVKPALHPDYETAEDIGAGHMSDTGFVNYTNLHPAPDVQAKIDAYKARLSAKNAAKTGVWLEDQY